MTKRFTVNWAAPSNNGGSAITGYDVGYTPSGGSETVTATGSTGTSYQISGLTDDTLYSVRVRAENSVGKGTWSNMFNRLAWLPSDIASLSLWLDASDTSSIVLATNTTSVTQLNDKSGNGRHVTQSTASKMPASSATYINNLNVIDFDGVDDVLQISLANHPLAASGSSAADFSFIVVLRTGSTLTNNGTFVTGSSGTNLLTIKAPNGGGQAIMNVGGTSGANQLAVSSFASSDQTFLAVFSNESTGKSIYKNGSLVGSDTSPVAITANTLLNFMNFYQGSLAEVLVVNAALSQADRQLAEGYLAHKWGLASDLPVGHPYKS